MMKRLIISIIAINNTIYAKNNDINQDKFRLYKRYINTIDSRDEWNLLKALRDTNANIVKKCTTGVVLIFGMLFIVNITAVIDDSCHTLESQARRAEYRQQHGISCSGYDSDDDMHYSWFQDKIIPHVKYYSACVTAFFYILGIGLYKRGFKTCGVLSKYCAIANVMSLTYIMEQKGRRRIVLEHAKQQKQSKSSKKSQHRRYRLKHSIRKIA